MRGKTIGIALKDRGAILPAGHTANAAYWFHGKKRANGLPVATILINCPIGLMRLIIPGKLNHT